MSNGGLAVYEPLASPSLKMLLLSQVLSKDELMKATGKKTNPELLVPCFQLQDTDHEGWMTKQGGQGPFRAGCQACHFHSNHLAVIFLDSPHGKVPRNNFPMVFLWYE